MGAKCANSSIIIAGEISPKKGTDKEIDIWRKTNLGDGVSGICAEEGGK